MSLKASYIKHVSNFILPGGTSRGVLSTKDSYIIEIHNTNNPTIMGTGEVSVIEKLSVDAVANLEELVAFVCANITCFVNAPELLDRFPAIRFGLEAALLDLKNGGQQIYFESDFTHDKDFISINGLIWMGNIDFMLTQIQDKIDQGYRCLKLKIGANAFDAEIRLLEQIRNAFSHQDLEIRLDANGAFALESAMGRLESLARYHIHSIEQPIKQGNWKAMQGLCCHSPIAIVLDEELIGITNSLAQSELIQIIQPQYIILKPSLLGGFQACDAWIEHAVKCEVKYWITSALETNVGLNAIAQWSYLKKIGMPQGLGTGKLFSNNYDSPLYLVGDKLFHKE